MSALSRGLFIVIEGIDCAGSSTQARLLTAHLRRRGRLVQMTSEPSAGPVGQVIRSYFSERIASNFDRMARDRFYGCLFAADRLDHIFNPTDGVLKQVSDGVDVISTRYKFSSLAYNCETEEERNFILAANSQLPMPDLLVYLRCPLEVSLKRMRERVTRETYEKEPQKLACALRNFERELSTYEGPKLVLDATLPEVELGFELARATEYISAQLEKDTYESAGAGEN